MAQSSDPSHSISAMHESENLEKRFWSSNAWLAATVDAQASPVWFGRIGRDGRGKWL